MEIRLWTDFETFCEKSIKFVGGANYCAHPSLDPLCMSWAIGDEAEVEVWTPKFGSELPLPVIDHIDQGFPIYAHNAVFEWRVFTRFWEEFGLTAPPPIKQFQDTMALAGMFGYPLNLDQFVKAVGVDEKDQKMKKEGTKLLNMLSLPCKPTKKFPHTRRTPQTHPEEFKRLYLYNKMDTVSMRAGVLLLPLEKLSGMEYTVWRHTQAQNIRGIPVDIDSVTVIEEKLAVFKEEQEKELARITGNEITTGKQHVRFRNYLKDRGVDTPSVDAQHVRDLLARPDLDPHIREVLGYRQRLAQSSVAKFTKIRELYCEDTGCIHDNQVYYGAHTGRVAGRGVNFHNLPRAQFKNPEEELANFLEMDMDELQTMYPDVNTAAKKLIRTMMYSGEENDFVVSDFKSIENRVIHWLAGDLKTIREFAQGLDQYKTFASAKFGVPYDEVSKDQRTYAKPNVLGLGFGGGKDALIRTAAQYGISMSEEDAVKAVKFYRSLYHLIPRLWYKFYEKCIHVIKNNSQYVFKTRWTKIGLQKLGNYFFIILPSGRRITYPQVSIKPGRHGRSQICYYGLHAEKKIWVKKYTHPGKIIENVVQAIARELLVYGSLSVEQAGYPVILTVYDEAVSLVPEGSVDIDEYNELLCIKPAWAETLPLDADGYIGKRYKKD